MLTLTHYLVLAAVMFAISVLGIFLNRKNVIVLLMAIELMLLAVNINLVAFSAFLGDLVGQVFAMFVLTVAAGEAAPEGLLDGVPTHLPALMQARPSTPASAAFLARAMLTTSAKTRPP